MAAMAAMAALAAICARLLLRGPKPVPSGAGNCEPVHFVDRRESCRTRPRLSLYGKGLRGDMADTHTGTDELDSGTALIRAEMSRLLEEIGRDPELAEEAKGLEEDLFSPMMGDQLPRLVEKVIGLAVLHMNRLGKSRQETETLLGQMMAQLDSLSAYMMGQTEDESHRTTSADTLNLQITGEMRAMGESMERSSDFEGLRRQLRDRVDAIGNHLHSYRQREQERARQSRERTESMRL